MLDGSGAAATLPRVLHAGCGGDTLESWPGITEVRLDIDPQFKPDIVAPLTALGDIGTFSMVYASHVIEHLYPHEVLVALREFWRVLEPGGTVCVVVPDLEDVRPDNTPLYESNSGPMTGLDLFYGCARSVEVNPYMAHHCGFIAATLRQVLEGAGFVEVKTVRMHTWNLLGGGMKPHV